VGSIAWFTLGQLTDQPALIWTNIVMTLLNLFGVWRWLGRQAKVEEGAQRAAAKSDEMPGESLFPASLLGSARLVSKDGKELGTLVDAMLGCRSGRLNYLVVAEGGVAGVGETLRRVDWHEAAVDGDRLNVRFDAARFGALPELARDDWPGR
jgi:sporulation protein YlmC with PRC-barrel domain